MPCGIGERLREGLAARVLKDGDQAGHAAALLVLATHEAPRALRRDQHHIEILARLDLLEVDIEAVREEERCALRKVLLDRPCRRLLREVGCQHRDEPGADDGRRQARRPRQAVLLRALPAFFVAAATHADDDIEAAVLQVQRMRAALAAVTDHGRPCARPG
jgi:hypothetical protein